MKIVDSGFWVYGIEPLALPIVQRTSGVRRTSTNAWAPRNHSVAVLQNCGFYWALFANRNRRRGSLSLERFSLLLDWSKDTLPCQYIEPKSVLHHCSVAIFSDSESYFFHWNPISFGSLATSHVYKRFWRCFTIPKHRFGTSIELSGRQTVPNRIF